MINAVIKSLRDEIQVRKKVFLLFLAKEKTFLWIVFFSIFASILFYKNPPVAMWIGFALAGYSAIANDSIQTLGTFIASNAEKKWYVLWIYIGVIFVITISTSWYLYSGDVSYQRLMSKGFAYSPQSFEFLQIISPLILLILTRLRMPVSTTFLLLSSFSSSLDGIKKVAFKSLNGYSIAFFTSLFIWTVFNKRIEKFTTNNLSPRWTIIQWIISGGLWAVWIMQDAANIAVFLPRSLTIIELLAFNAYIFFGLGILFYLKGDKIQSIVQEKTDVENIKSATLIDFVYTVILIGFQYVSNVPMSTTWVFIGLLAGREIAYLIVNKFENKEYIFRMVGRDLVSALIGLIISILIAIAVNPNLYQHFWT